MYAITLALAHIALPAKNISGATGLSVVLSRLEPQSLNMPQLENQVTNGQTIIHLYAALFGFFSYKV